MAAQVPILTAGGGIGGLAAALGLAQKGFASILVEKSPSLGEIGAGIQLGPNAFHGFDYLGDSARARRLPGDGGRGVPVAQAGAKPA